MNLLNRNENPKSFLNRSLLFRFLLTLGVLAILSADGRARSRSDKDGFPDYNRLEYAKPLPPVDEQQPESKPGSIQRRFGDKPVSAGDTIPLNALPISLRPTPESDESEPPISDLLDQTEVIKSTTTPPGVPSATAPTTEKLQ
jgi:hypothetical protein